jgi:hypothetical protein
MRIRPARIVSFVLSLVVGAAYGTAASVAQAFALGWFPLGLIVAVVGTGALLLALRLLTGDRWTALAGGAGVLLTMVLFSQVGPGGSAIVAAQSSATEWVPLAWTVSVPLLVALVVAWPDAAALRPRAEDPPVHPA